MPKMDRFGKFFENLKYRKFKWDSLGDFQTSLKCPDLPKYPDKKADPLIGNRMQWNFAKASNHLLPLARNFQVDKG